MREILRANRWLFVVLFLWATMAALYAVYVPSFEGPDEAAHLHYAWFIAEHHRLPRQLPLPPEVPAEGHQPPLYYAAISPVVALLDFPHELISDIHDYNWLDVTADWEELLRMYGSTHRLLQPNPQSNRGTGAQPNRFLHWPQEVSADWQAVEQRVTLVRLASVPYGIVTLLSTWIIIRRLTKERIYHILGVVLAGFVPQFVFISALVNNDGMSCAVAASVMALWAHRWDRPVTSRWSISVGLLVGVGILTKTTLFFLVPLGILGYWLNSSSRKEFLLHTGLMCAVAAITVSPWLVRNQLLYGDPLGGRMQQLTLPALHNPLTLLDPYFLHTFPRDVVTSFYARFGWMSVGASSLGLRIFAGVGLLAAIGMVVQVLRSVSPATAPPTLQLWLIACVVLVFGELLLYNTMYPQPQGRFLFPALPAIAGWATLGLHRISDRRCLLPIAIGLIWLPLSAWELIRSLLPAYY